MKKSIFTLLLLSIFSLLPFVTFSVTFTSNNPIVLPTTTTTNTYDYIDNQVLEYEEDEFVRTGAEYRIYSPELKGGVYLTHLEISDSKCPKGVVLHDNDTKGEGMPVKFETVSNPYDVVAEGLFMNIKFSIPTAGSCDNETVWKAADPDQTASGKRFIVTGGSTEVPEDKNEWFQIERVGGLKFKLRYKLRYCACDGEVEDDICPVIDCKYVGVTHLHSGKPRLFLTDAEPLPVVFKKVSK